MRILFVHNQYQQYGGEDTTVRAERALLEANGHEVELLLFDNADIKTFMDKAFLLWSSIRNGHSFERLRTIIKAFRPDVVHFHNTFYVASSSIFWVAKEYNLPVVATMHNYRLICSGAYLLRDGKICELCVTKAFPIHGVVHGCFRGSHMLTAHLTINTGINKVRGTYRNAVDRFITLTDFNRQKFLSSSMNLRTEQVMVKPNSVDDVGYSPADERNGAYLFVGRLAQEKGLSTLLDAAVEAGFQLDILGTGPLKGKVESYSAYHSNIRYLGFKPRDIILDYMRRAKALIFPSLWYEGLPFTILEAMSTGMPVIVSDLGNLNEIVTDGVDGLHFSTGNAQELAQKVLAFDADLALRTHLGQGARQTYLARYSPSTNYQNLITLYQQVIKENKAKMPTA